MKRTIIALCLGLCTSAMTSAQSIYKTVVEQATETINNAKASTAEKSQNKFILDALKYLDAQTKARGESREPYFFDAQAVNVLSFVTDYAKNMATAGTKSAAISKVYQNAIASNPLFEDADPAAANVYVKEGSPTPFSLNCDWEKANDAATKKLRQVLK